MFHEGIYRRGFPCEIKSRYHINSAGWNANREYYEHKTADTRIAIIGDSFVEALEVDVDKSVAGVLERDLNKSLKRNIEVYRFGIPYAAMSQYLRMMEYVKKKYDPDIIIVLIVYNDFLDSIYGFGNPYDDLLQFAKKGASWVEIEPDNKFDYIKRLKWSLKKSSVLRYLYLNLDLDHFVSFLVCRFKNEKVEMYVKTKEIVDNLTSIESLCSYIFYRFKKISGPETKLLLIMDTNRDAIYEGKDPRDAEIYSLNKIASDTARQLSIPFIDMQNAFMADYKKNKKLFDFRCDKHWNSNAHFIAGKTISKFIQEQKWIR
jgi:hypothetical protein